MPSRSFRHEECRIAAQAALFVPHFFFAHHICPHTWRFLVPLTQIDHHSILSYPRFIIIMSSLSSTSLSGPRRLAIMVTFWWLFFLLVGFHSPCHAWTTTTTKIQTFTQPKANNIHPFHMDVEYDIATTRPFLHPSSWKPLVIPGKQGQGQPSSSSTKTTTLGFDVDAIFLLPYPQDDRLADSSSHSMSSSMPWKTSIVSSSASDDETIECTLSPFWKMQVETLEASCQNLQWHHHHQPQSQQEDPYYLESESGQHRMRTWTGSSDEYRHIRLTYVDGGTNLQIFSSVCYPREIVPSLDDSTAMAALPILGMEVLQMNHAQRQLGICDFQPLPQTTTTTTTSSHHYEELLVPIRQEAPQLQETMTNRFFDPSRYFSSQTLLGRGTNAGDSDDGDNQKASTVPTESWLPSFQAYLKTHIDMVQQQAQQQQEQPHTSSASSTSTVPTTTPTLLQLHKAYDNYVASCDPAFPMFASIFGPERATRYIYNVLFPLADEPSTSLSSSSTTRTKR